MDKNHSPWLAELNKDRQPHAHDENIAYEVAIVGGGIAGMVTAYYALTQTEKTVLLVEATRIAHGATGHNAGQVVDYFEKPFSEIAIEYGLPMAVEGQKAVTGAWKLVEEILEETRMRIPFARFMGYAGCTTMDQLLVHLENKYQKCAGGLHVERAMLAQELIKKENIPTKYHDFCSFIPHAEVLKHLETPHMKYIAALQSRKGTMNSALFVEKLSDYLLETYRGRFAIREHAPVDEVH
ncbi:MAG: FAD-binding oxidoreductase, partial [Rickettsiaceae bacterium]|nr:FAD-binding oxidoreductase [Rickettsiaceae bacterium]